ncbi:MAG: tRNA (N6-threonylcarbamoyladenosine(37)-N6)-methyltransferase TrmO [bacterium]|nr:tRNA (N6-threonylcarbamoyladenosine(37)-N6)-methyltransferase TrmO [bacterium]
MRITYSPIGRIHSPFTSLEGMPIQPRGAADVEGRIEIYPQFRQGLRDLDGFSHIYVLSHLHAYSSQSDNNSPGDYKLLVTPFLDTEQRGLFATRAPTRPNPIGLSVLRLKAVTEDGVQVLGIDLLDATPVLDIKPYVPEFDLNEECRSGWLEGRANRADAHKSDGRFSANNED